MCARVARPAWVPGPSASPLAVMRKRVRYLILIALLGAGCATPHGTLDARKQYWRTRLGSELPTGSGLATARKLFEAAHLEQHYDSKSSILSAIERNVSHSLFVSCDVLIDCTFNGQALQECIVKSVCTGP